MSGDSFRPEDIALHARLGIDASLLAAAGVRRVTTREAREQFGIASKSTQSLDGIVYPYFHVLTGARVTCRLRRDHPEVDEHGKPVNKYLAPFGDTRALFFPPGATALVTDPSVIVVPVESEKSALALMAAATRADRRLLALGLGGCWGWKGTIGKTTDAGGARVDQKGPLPDLDRIVWSGRDVVILLDANAATNSKVQAARRALASELTNRGAYVRIAELPIEDGVNGPDDYVGKHGDAALFALIDTTKSLTSRPGKKEKTDKPKQGRGVQLEDPEPWADPVHGDALLDALAATFSRYLALPAHAATALALWVLHAFTFDAWFASPFLAVTSPVKRCGKTLCLIVLGALVPRRLFASNVTPAVLFRTIEKYSPVLLIDEADTFVRDNDELRGVLNSGHTRTTAVAIRAVGDDHDPRAFSTWCAKAVALIGKLPGTLADRAIEIPMRRRTAGERVERLRQDRIEGACADLRRQAARWAADHLHALQDADPEVPAALHDRAADCWRPLLAIADAVGAAWPQRAREAALALSGEPADDDATTLLLRDVRDIFAAADDPDVLASSTIVEQLVALEDRPWAEWSRGRPLSTAKLARMLAGYGVQAAGVVRIGTKTPRGYRRAAFVDVWDRYLETCNGISEVQQRNKPNENGAELAISKCNTDSDCCTLESATNPMNTESCCAVALPKGGEGEDAALDRYAEATAEEDSWLDL